MKEPRPYLLAIVSVFLIISVVLLAATAYLYYKSPVEFAVVPKNQNTNRSGTRDSLQKIYSATIKDLNSSVDALSAGYKDSTEIQQPYPAATNDSGSAYEKLRAEINSILADKSSDADLGLAKQKIGQLQSMVDMLKDKNYQISVENERLNKILKQYSVQKDQASTEIKTSSEHSDKIQQTNTAPILKVQTVLLTAFSSSNFIDKETSQAESTDKLIGSITVKCLSTAEPVSELIVVILQPDGTVMQNSNWETGIFYTKSGKHIYSKKLRFNNVTGEVKKINFSVENEKYIPGKYSIEVYHEGALVGTGFKILS